MNLQFIFETATERQARTEYEDTLIEVYVPEAGEMTREEALVLAQERDLQASIELRSDVIMLRNLEKAASQ
jgi:hypothetical protein